MIGGVAGGLGEYLNVDPILLRVAFAGLMIFGGAGLVLYVVGWLLIPESGRDDSIVQAALRMVARRTGRLGAVALVIVAVVAIGPWASNRFDSFSFPSEVFWALVIALIGVVLLLPGHEPGTAEARAFGPRVAVGESAAGTDQPGRSVAGEEAPGWTHPSRPAPRVQARSPLGWYTLAGALLVIGVLATVDTAGSVRVLPGQYFGGGILALGIGLVIGAWKGRARLLILAGLVVLPLAATAAFLTVPLEGGMAVNDFRPQNIAEVQGAYRLVAGRLRIDLTDLDAAATPVALSASVGVGEIFVIVPEDASVEVTGTVQAGQLLLFGREHTGTGLSDRISGSGNGSGVVLILRLDVGIGQVQVERTNMGGY